ncbi:hypothetical protein ACLKA7_015285 [Drosophila subpalustris]
MEHVNTINARQQQQQQQQLQQNQLEQQQQHNENQQQFCLRWHNHQTSLLSTLPILLDQSHLTDVTISAEGRLLRAHRVVLSACSSFFMEIFRALEASNHPVIIIPGASFGAIVALLTFMYSGEVNVYEEQIPMLLNLAETLGIKGLADVQNNNLPKTTKSTSATTPTSYVEPTSIDKPLGYETPRSATPTPTPTPTATPNLSIPQLPNPTLQTPLLANKLGTPLENFFFKSLQFYPNLLPQPLNFSQTALNKTTELLAKYQQQCQLYQNSLEDEDCYGAKRMKTGSGNQSNNISTAQSPKDVKRIDKIVENLRTTNSSKSPIECGAPNSIVASSSVALAPQNMSHFSPQLPVVKSSPSYSNPLSAGQLYSSAKLPSYSAAATPTTAQQASHQVAHHASTSYITPEDHAKLQQHIEQYAACQREAAAAAAAAAAAGQMVSAKSEPNLLSLSAEKMPTPNKPPSNSKLYATCFICHKQLSNQYNLRVHLETHQNVRYACNVCSHVSRSKDALRKHVSYRHPGAPSPCENEARRKRVTKLAAQSTLTSSAASAPSATATSGDMAAAGEASVLSAGSGSSSGSLSANPYLFLPNQFQLAAAAAAVAVAESTTTTAALDLAHELPVSIKSTTSTASNGDAGSEAGGASAT